MACVKYGKPTADCSNLCGECMDKLIALSKWQNEQWETDYIVCPYCGYVDMDSWEIDEGHYDEFECPSCEEVFEVECEYRVTYTSRKRACDYEGNKECKIT